MKNLLYFLVAILSASSTLGKKKNKVYIHSIPISPQEKAQDYFNKFSQMSIFEAVYDNDPLLVSALIGMGVGVHAKNYRGNTPLIEASDFGNIDIIRSLVAAGSDVDEVNLKGTTALMIAAKEGHSSALSLLMRLDSNLDRKNNSGESAITLGTKEGKTYIVRQLIQQGANFNIENKDKDSPLTLAAHWGHSRLVKVLLDMKGIKVNHRNKLGNSALMESVRSGNIKIIQDLITAKADVNNENIFGDTALVYAVQKNSIKAVKMLIAEGVIDCRKSIELAKKKEFHVIEQVLRFYYQNHN